MGIITRFVDVRVNAFTCNYYSKKGYEIPKKLNKKGELKIDTSKTIQVHVLDLPLNSHAVIQVSCENCGKIIDVVYENYNKVIKKHSKYLCFNCANSEYNSGENNSNWNPNLTDEDRKSSRNTSEYIELVRNVFYRDDYTCQYCGRKGGKLHMHHKNGYMWCVEGRLDMNNCVTLCIDCHYNFHGIYGKKYNTEQQFNEWIKQSQLELKHNEGFLPPSRKVYCYEDDIIYNSVNLAKIRNNYKSISNIYSVCNHKKNYKTAYGKHWFWYDEYINMTWNKILFYLN